MCTEHTRSAYYTVSESRKLFLLLTQTQEVPNLQLVPLGREAREQQTQHVEGGQPEEPGLGPVCLLRDTPLVTCQRQRPRRQLPISGSVDSHSPALLGRGGRKKRGSGNPAALPSRNLRGTHWF